MNFFIRTVLLLFSFVVSLEGYSQLITNPSFEGRSARQAEAPFPWMPCHFFSTPDTQPGVFGVSTPPSQGNSYIGLVTRGNLGPYANTVEDAQVQLTAKLEADTRYDFSIDLAFSTAFGHFGDTDFVSYANPVKLQIWGGVNSCEKTELLWESPPVDHTNWNTYNFSITPKLQGINYLILEANYVTTPTYFGNILIDNIIENKLPDPEPTPCMLETFNVFTPNGDGYNDVFIFKSVGTIARFKFQIYNRWGILMFETNDLEHGWDGKHKGSECATGVYFWYVHYMCIENDTIIEHKRKGTVTMLK